ncbi:MAG: hypothetical protein ACRET2_13050 [Steroidobacteraceae bacterium]
MIGSPFLAPARTYVVALGWVAVLALAAMLTVTGCSPAHRAPNPRASAGTADAQAYRGPAVLTGEGDLAACPLESDLDQYVSDMKAMRLDSSDPGYGVASAYDLHNRHCIELQKSERVDVERGNSTGESLVRPTGRSQAYWTSASWTRG